jgi:hypothetical protein
MDKSNQAPKKSAAIEELAKKFMPEPRMVSVSARIPEWLATALDRTLTELRSQGSKITKEAVVTAALQEYLEVSGPE